MELRFGGKKQDAAKAIGITPSRYSRVYKGNQYSLNTENCLRLAQLVNEQPGTVLRLAGKLEVANLLDSLYASQNDSGQSFVVDSNVLAALKDPAALEEVRWFMNLPSRAKQWLLTSKDLFGIPELVGPKHESPRASRGARRTTSARSPRQ